MATDPPENAHERGWSLADIGAGASIVALGITLAVAKAQTLLIGSLAGALILTVAIQRLVFRSRFRHVLGLLAGLRAQLGTQRVQLDRQALLLKQRPGYDYRLSHATFRIDTDQEMYFIEQHKILHNAGTRPIEFILAFFTCNRFPEDPKRSRHFYAEHPIEWDDLGVGARDKVGELDVELTNDWNNRKEFIIRMLRNRVPRPVPVGDELDLRYGYHVPFDRWGTYFDKPIDRPTELLQVKLVIPIKVGRFDTGVLKLSPSGPPEMLVLTPVKDVEEGWQTHLYEIAQPEVGCAYQFTWDFDGIERTESTSAIPSEATTAIQV